MKTKEKEKTQWRPIGTVTFQPTADNKKFIDTIKAKRGERSKIMNLALAQYRASVKVTSTH